MNAKLIVVHGRASRDVIDLDLPTVIGRSPEADLTIGHPQISRQHCMLYESDGLLMIKDLGSTNGTYVDSRRVAEAPLRPDDEFTIGPLTFRADYQYAGDLRSLPPTRWAETPVPSPGFVPPASAAEGGPWAHEPTPLDSQVLEVRIVPHPTPAPAASAPPADAPAAIEFEEVADAEQPSEPGVDGDAAVEQHATVVDAVEPTPAPAASESSVDEPSSRKPPLRRPPAQVAAPTATDAPAAEPALTAPPDPFRPSVTDDLTLDDFLDETDDRP